MIVGVLGSGSAGSLTRLALAAVAAEVRAAGLGFCLIDLRREFRELRDPADHAEPKPDGQTARLRARLLPATGVVLATPVYHGSFSGLLKNALDQCTGDAFDRLPVGILAAGGGPRSAAVACDHLRTVVRAMGGWATPTHIGLSPDDMTEDGPGEALRQRIAEMIAELAFFIRATRTAHPAPMPD